MYSSPYSSQQVQSSSWQTTGSKYYGRPYNRYRKEEPLVPPTTAKTSTSSSVSAALLARAKSFTSLRTERMARPVPEQADLQGHRSLQKKYEPTRPRQFDSYSFKYNLPTKGNYTSSLSPNATSVNQYQSQPFKRTTGYLNAYEASSRPSINGSNSQKNRLQLLLQKKAQIDKKAQLIIQGIKEPPNLSTQQKRTYSKESAPYMTMTERERSKLGKLPEPKDKLFTDQNKDEPTKEQTKIFSETAQAKYEPKMMAGKRGKFMDDLVLVSKAGSEIMKK